MASESALQAVVVFNKCSLKHCFGLLVFIACAVAVLLLPRLRTEPEVFIPRLSTSPRTSKGRAGVPTRQATGQAATASLPPAASRNSSARSETHTTEQASDERLPARASLQTDSPREIDSQHLWLHASAPSGRSPHAMLTELLEKQGEIQRQMRTGKRQSKAIVGKCPQNDFCGGIGDRLFGIVTLFTAAVVTERAFFIEHSKPVPQVDYINPHHLDWRMSTVESPPVKQQLKDCIELKTCKLHNLQTKISHPKFPTSGQHYPAW